LQNGFFQRAFLTQDTPVLGLCIRVVDLYLLPGHVYLLLQLVYQCIDIIELFLCGGIGFDQVLGSCSFP